MRQLNGVYTQRFNVAHKRTGHVFQGRYKAILVDKDSHLLELCRYIALNPIRAHACEKAEQCPWSSYKATAGLIKGPDFLTSDWILMQFSPEKEKAKKAYRRFVREGLSEESPLQKIQGRMFLGNADFVKKFKQFLRKAEMIKEIPKYQRYAARPEMKDIINGEGKEERDNSIYLAHIKYGYTLKEVADYFNLHYSTISKVVKRVEAKYF
jgi:hypothetical protein